MADGISGRTLRAGLSITSSRNTRVASVRGSDEKTRRRTQPTRQGARVACTTRRCRISTAGDTGRLYQGGVARQVLDPNRTCQLHDYTCFSCCAMYMTHIIKRLLARPATRSRADTCKEGRRLLKFAVFVVPRGEERVQDVDAEALARTRNAKKGGKVIKEEGTEWQS